MDQQAKEESHSIQLPSTFKLFCISLSVAFSVKFIDDIKQFNIQLNQLFPNHHQGWEKLCLTVISNSSNVFALLAILFKGWRQEWATILTGNKITSNDQILIHQCTSTK